MKKLVCPPMPVQLSEYERGKADAFDEVYSSKAPPDPGFPVTVCSVPGSAWDVLARDRDEWKTRATYAADRVAELEAELAARDNDQRMKLEPTASVSEDRCAHGLLVRDRASCFSCGAEEARPSEAWCSECHWGPARGAHAPGCAQLPLVKAEALNFDSAGANERKLSPDPEPSEYQRGHDAGYLAAIESGNCCGRPSDARAERFERAKRAWREITGEDVSPLQCPETTLPKPVLDVLEHARALHNAFLRIDGTTRAVTMNGLWARLHWAFCELDKTVETEGEPR